MSIVRYYPAGVQLLSGGTLKRREFITTSIATAGLALARGAEAQMTPAAAPAREFYELRRYHLQSGPQSKLAENYFADALIPALNRMGISPVGVFSLTIGPETPVIYVLLPSSRLEALVTVQSQLVHDEQFMSAAAPFWNAPATAPAFVRDESSLLIAFEGWPKLVVPPSTAQHANRIFQLRTYESASDQDHVRKVEMFHHGEFEIFRKSGFSQVFYGDTLVGPRMPNLTYMLSFSDLADMDAKWKVFENDPEWKKLSSSPRYSFEAIVSNISNLVLKPLSCSQI